MLVCISGTELMRSQHAGVYLRDGADEIPTCWCVSQGRSCCDINMLVCISGTELMRYQHAGVYLRDGADEISTCWCVSQGRS